MRYNLETKIYKDTTPALRDASLLLIMRLFFFFDKSTVIHWLRRAQYFVIYLKSTQDEYAALGLFRQLHARRVTAVSQAATLKWGLRRNGLLNRQHLFGKNFYTLMSSGNFFEFTPNAVFQFLYMSGLTRSGILLKGVFFSQWTRASNLLMSVFFFQIRTAVFGVPNLRRETELLNWLQLDKLGKISKIDYTAFTTSRNAFGLAISEFFSSLHKNKVQIVFITDSDYHSRNLFYLQKNCFFTIGLIASSQNPWLVSYSLPVFASNISTQLFFLKFVLYAKKSAATFKYEVALSQSGILNASQKDFLMTL